MNMDVQEDYTQAYFYKDHKSADAIVQQAKS